MTAETVTSQTAARGPETAPASGRPTPPVTASLSPSRAADFKTCPLLYRFRSIDRLPERTSVDQARGTLVHAVLERLFDLPADQRTPAAAADLVAPQWERLVTEQAELADVFTADDLAGPVEFLESARGLLDGYFTVEDPRRLEPAERESLVSTVVDDELLIRGYIDRLDVSPDGALRVVDYKTGGAPREAFEARALFQLKFYALVLWRTRGVVPKVLRLLYLKDAEICDYAPDADELVRFERTVLALWHAIEQATRARDFRPRPSRLCGWCNHQAHCPAFGGTPPPFPEPATAVGPATIPATVPVPTQASPTDPAVPTRSGQEERSSS
ncbi:RecB family exonuclease [Plantactinospora solaniradicis]|uniref:RecB family exonuclease n=1 Tax=Plantactinospora solaniradicis TaxID=1723736 RepID=A0ABW1K480_9ACTN